MSDAPREVLRDHAWKMLHEYRGLLLNLTDDDWVEETDVLEFLRAYERMRFEEEQIKLGTYFNTGQKRDETRS